MTTADAGPFPIAFPGARAFPDPSARLARRDFQRTSACKRIPHSPIRSRRLAARCSPWQRAGCLAQRSAVPKRWLRRPHSSFQKRPKASNRSRYRCRKSAIDDLKRRLASTRWPERETVTDWSQGVPLQKAQALVAYWRDKYDWRRFEARINAFPQYRTQIDRLGIHFIHVRSPQRNALPIILTHGWPGSVVEFMEIIGPLSDPTRYGGTAEDAFHVVAPRLRLL
jgi:hypothetical protein